MIIKEEKKYMNLWPIIIISSVVRYFFDELREKLYGFMQILEKYGLL